MGVTAIAQPVSQQMSQFLSLSRHGRDLFEFFVALARFVASRVIRCPPVSFRQLRGDLSTFD